MNSKQKTLREARYGTAFFFGMIFGMTFLTTIILITVGDKTEIENRGYALGVNETLSNNTLMFQVANNINLYYVNQYNSIPIFYQDKVFACTNISEVKK